MFSNYTLNSGEDWKAGNQNLSTDSNSMGDAKISQAHVYEWFYCFKVTQMSTEHEEYPGCHQPL
jgi:hypothetical protein